MDAADKGGLALLGRLDCHLGVDIGCHGLHCDVALLCCICRVVVDDLGELPLEEGSVCLRQDPALVRACWYPWSDLVVGDSLDALFVEDELLRSEIWQDCRGHPLIRDLSVDVARSIALGRSDDFRLP